MAAAISDSPRQLASLLQGLAPLPASLDVPVSELVEDSRQVVPGALFLARSGQTVDASRFAAQARARRAVAMVYQGDGAPGVDDAGLLRIPVSDLPLAVGIIADRFFGQPSRHMPVVAVTGTNGKSSVTHHVADAYTAAQERPAGIIGTLGSGLSGALRPGALTTPDCVSVHRTLARLREAGAALCVMEASSHALDQQRLAGVRVDTAVFTNLSRDHLDYHGDMQAYAHAKARLFRDFAPRGAVLNADDAASGQFRAAVDGTARVMRFSLRGAADAEVQGRILRADRSGVTLAVKTPDQRCRFASPVLGEHGAQNLLAAFTVLVLRGMPPEQAALAMARVRPVPGRLQARGGADGPLVVVDYAHTPAALEAALAALRPLCGGELWCVFGAGGDRDRGKRALMGAAAANGAARLVITDDNPRGEDGDDIIAQIRAGLPAGTAVTVQRDRARAIAMAVSCAAPDDVVLVAGKGHETGQTIAGEVLPFNDLEQVERALEGRVQ
jgi:UDP-N-acetylmuramoyl-L-alanyl-D-glutamate--2,6-diaminopimelate ligase